MGWQGLYANDALSSVQGGCEDGAPLRPSLGGDGQGYRQTYLQMAEPQPGNSTPGVGPRDRNLITESVSCAEMLTSALFSGKLETPRAINV